MKAAINIVAFQLGWWCCVLGAARGGPWLGPVFALVWLPLHLRFFGLRREAGLVAVCVLFGGLLDSAVMVGGFVAYPPGFWLAPPWIWALWALFGTTLHHSMRWLRRRWLLGLVLGAIFGPLAYRGAAALGAVTLPRSEGLTLLVLGLVWGGAMPLLGALAGRFEPRRAQSSPAQLLQ